MAASITLEQLEKDVAEIIKGADLSQLSSKKIRKQLEEKYDMDLTDRKQEIDNIVMSQLDDEKDEDEVEDKKGDVSKADKSAEEDEDSDDSDSELEDDGPGPSKKVKKNDDEALAEALQNEESGRRSRNCKKPVKKAPVKEKPKKDPKKQQQFELTPALASVMGRDRMPRSEVVKRMWEIVKERNLQDPKNRQFMICDEELQKVFGRKRVRTFGMMKYLKDQMYKPGDKDIIFTS